jgi:hypothetical protein
MLFANISIVLRTFGFTPMRLPRVKAEGQSFYHCVSQRLTVDSFFATVGHGSLEAERFVLLIRRLEAFSGVRVLTYALMSKASLTSKTAAYPYLNAYGAGFATSLMAFWSSFTFSLI